MKILIILLIMFGMYSCTFIEHANTEVNCPCIVKEVSFDSPYYKIKAYRDDSRVDEWFTFYTTKYHQLGDTIQ